MPKFHVVIADCKRYEVEAENGEAAVKQISHDHYDFAGDLRKYEFVDFFTKFENEGEVQEDDEE